MMSTEDIFFERKNTVLKLPNVKVLSASFDDDYKESAIFVKFDLTDEQEQILKTKLDSQKSQYKNLRVNYNFDKFKLNAFDIRYVDKDKYKTCSKKLEQYKKENPHQEKPYDLVKEHSTLKNSLVNVTFYLLVLCGGPFVLNPSASIQASVVIV